MECFYRLMRKKTGLLIDEDDKPVGGKWNFDHDNRKKYKGDPPVPRRPVQTLDESETVLIEQISKIFLMILEILIHRFTPWTKSLPKRYGVIF